MMILIPIDVWIIYSTFGYGVLLIWGFSVVIVVIWVISDSQEFYREEYPRLDEFYFDQSRSRRIPNGYIGDIRKQYNHQFSH